MAYVELCGVFFKSMLLLFNSLNISMCHKVISYLVVFSDVHSLQFYPY
jgi:hypothetical protein